MFEAEQSLPLGVNDIISRFVNEPNSLYKDVAVSLTEVFGGRCTSLVDPEVVSHDTIFLGARLVLLRGEGKFAAFNVVRSNLPEDTRVIRKALLDNLGRIPSGIEGVRAYMARAIDLVHKEGGKTLGAAVLLADLRSQDSFIQPAAPKSFKDLAWNLPVDPLIFAHSLSTCFLKDSRPL